MKFFLPDWDDRVDPGYDFGSDRFTLVRDPYRDDLYAHEVFAERPYDGLLVSRMSLLRSGPKRAMVERIGMRRYLRLPADLELFGDCGAFGYLRAKEPPFDTEDVLDYYERLQFDYGVSVDHAIVPEFASEQAYRYELTLRNARRFLELHRARGCRFVCVGACQGWDATSYANAAVDLVAMGYEYIAVGGLARSNTKTVADVMTAVVQSVPESTRIHVFGVARTTLLESFCHYGVASVDSAAPLRQAWLSGKHNYHTLDDAYIAIRIPVAGDERAKAETLVARSTATLAMLTRAEGEALRAVRAYDRGQATRKVALEACLEYDSLLAQRLDRQTERCRKELYERTLGDRPWRRCTCDVCAAIGVEVIIFRGNNRNRRRGFHNLCMARRRIRRIRDAREIGRPLA